MKDANENPVLELMEQAVVLPAQLDVRVGWNS
jgi:hypothetical protein